MTTGFHLLEPWRNPPLHTLPKRRLNVTAGRSKVFVLEHPNGPIVERPYRHGGLRRFFLPRLFVKSDRPARELDYHLRVWRAGVPTVQPVGWRETAGSLPGFRRYCYYTTLLADAHPLPQRLAGEAPGRQHIAEMAAILAQMFALGIYHHDLNLNNWLLADDRVFLIDFDKAADINWDACHYLAVVGARIARSGKKLGLLKHRRAFLRLMVTTAGLLGIRARAVLENMPPTLTQIRFTDKIRWMLSGGYQNSV